MDSLINMSPTLVEVKVVGNILESMQVKKTAVGVGLSLTCLNCWTMLSFHVCRYFKTPLSSFSSPTRYPEAMVVIWHENRFCVLNLLPIYFRVPCSTGFFAHSFTSTILLKVSRTGHSTLSQISVRKPTSRRQGHSLANILFKRKLRGKCDTQPLSHVRRLRLQGQKYSSLSGTFFVDGRQKTKLLHRQVQWVHIICQRVYFCNAIILSSLKNSTFCLR